MNNADPEVAKIKSANVHHRPGIFTTIGNRHWSNLQGASSAPLAHLCMCVYVCVCMNGPLGMESEQYFKPSRLWFCDIRIYDRLQIRDSAVTGLSCLVKWRVTDTGAGCSSSHFAGGVFQPYLMWAKSLSVADTPILLPSPNTAVDSAALYTSTCRPWVKYHRQNPLLLV